MGSDRKSKEKKHSKRSFSSSASEDEGRSNRKRQKSVEDEERRSSRKHNDKKEKLKHKKTSYKHHSDKEMKSKDKHKGKHSKGDHNSSYEFHELSNDDYFSKNNEFATWLKDEKNVFFSDLSSESAREMFKDFVKAWNKQKLESRYYEGIVTGPRSAHNWKIRG